MCAYCGEKSQSLHQEHIIPISRGGDDSIGNLVPACPDCNLAKGDRTLMEWRLGKKSPRYRTARHRQNSPETELADRPARPTAGLENTDLADCCGVGESESA
ncbi:HNH endonuclease [Streptomyces blastmyceticus]